MSESERPKFVVVLGHESSGTRLVARAIARASGWDYDDGEYSFDEQGRVIDSFMLKTVHGWWEKPETIVRDHSRITRRSLPHGGFVDLEQQSALVLGRKFFDPVPFIEGLERAGYEVYVVLTVRDRTIAEHSKYREHTQQHLDVARTEMDRAVETMNRVLERHARTFVCGYEAGMTLGRPYIQHLYRFLGISSEHSPPLRDGNRKYIKDLHESGRVRLNTDKPLTIGMVTRPTEQKWGGDLRALYSMRDGLS
ncbi:MAG: hypothetical protein HYV26_06410, partial [Candidatus Hydrogenedentes bacterium]|nr:hypothetical protein [Candidatus Hydrogenedentota bacterium]